MAQQPGFWRDIWIGLGISLLIGIGSLVLATVLSSIHWHGSMGILSGGAAHIGLIVYAVVKRRYGLLVGWALCHAIGVLLVFMVCGGIMLMSSWK